MSAGVGSALIGAPDQVASACLEQLERAWNAGDGFAFAAPFAAGCDFVDIRGEHHRGAAAVAHGHQAIFDTIYAGSRVEYRLESARLATGDCIVAVATSTLNAPTGPLAGRHQSRFTLVVTGDAGGHQIAAFHNTLLATLP